MKTTKNITWNEFQALCKEAWATGGQGSNDVQLAHSYLLRCGKKPKMTLQQVASSAYRLMQSENMITYALSTN